ncbi:MAG TPA: alpha/beta fold hydrolase [Egibacteraceae bacterium]|nr:alpha/beta fold hydrolase [Egibacteraceae bacterium]
MPGCEAWSAEGGDVGVLVVHGFTGNPSSMRPLAEALAAQGYAVELPRLPGHGTRWQCLQKTTWHDWTREVVAAFETLRARTRARVAVGLSGGGALGLYLAETRGEHLSGLALVNPWLYHTDPFRVLLPVAKWVLPAVPGVGNDIAKPGADEKPYPKVPLKAAASFIAFQRRVRARLGAVTVPTLLFTTRQDHVFDPERNSRLLLEGIASADVEQVWLERSYHVATLDYDADEIITRTAAFTARVTKG